MKNHIHFTHTIVTVVWFLLEEGYDIELEGAAVSIALFVNTSTRFS